jgi:hypothetical protein
MRVRGYECYLILADSAELFGRFYRHLGESIDCKWKFNAKYKINITFMYEISYFALN